MNLTQLEQQIVNAFEHVDEWDGCPAMTFFEIVEWTRISHKKLRGAISSLVQKGYLVEDELPTCTAFTLRK